MKNQKLPNTSLGAIVVHVFRHNIGYKILALLIALVLWSALIAQDPTLTREKIFQDVNVTVSGSETLKRNGYIVTSDLSELLGDVTVKAAVPQSKYNDVSVSSYNIRLDLTKIKSSGTAELKLQGTSGTTYGTVTEITPSSIPVNVEEYVTRYRIPVSLIIEGEGPEGYYVGPATISPSVITVSGPKSLVESISRARAVVNLSELPAQEVTFRTASNLVLIDRQGEAVESSLIEITSESVLLDSVIVEQEIYPTAGIALSDANLVTGTPGAGYEIKSITYSPEIVTAAASASDLQLIDTLFANSSIDVTGVTSSFTRSLSVRRPAEIVNLSPSSFTVTVEIGPVTKNKAFTGLKVNVDGCGSDLRSSVSLISVNVSVSGPQLWVNALKNADLRVSCDASGLAAGAYELPLTCTITADDMPEHTVTLSAPTVTVTLKDK